jgi:hypothetical protein
VGGGLADWVLDRQRPAAAASNDPALVGQAP